MIGFGSLATTLSLGWGPKLGLDLAGGLSVVYKPTTPATQSQLNEVVTILSNRVNGLGVSGAQVNVQGKNVVVSAPGVKDAQKILKEIGQTAQLFFRTRAVSGGPGREDAPSPSAPHDAIVRGRLRLDRCQSGGDAEQLRQRVLLNSTRSVSTRPLPTSPRPARRSDMASQPVILPTLGHRKPIGGSWVPPSSRAKRSARPSPPRTPSASGS